MWLRWHPDEVIAQHVYWLPPGSIRILRLKHQRTGDELIQISMLTTPTQRGLYSTFWLPDITYWWRQQKETHWKYADLSNVAHVIFSIIPHCVGLEASFSVDQDVSSWRRSKTTGETLREIVVVRQFARANDGILAGGDPALDATNTEIDSEMKEQRKKGNCPEWPKFTTFWRCDRAPETYMLPRTNLALRTSRWLPWDRFRTRKKLSEHPGHSFNMIVRLHLHRKADFLCCHLSLQRSSLEAELND